jgi:curved DNA-binding protein CbpA
VLDTAQAYQVLQLRQGSSFDEIKYAYRKRVLESHPDKNNNEKDGAKFQLVAEAYHFLKNSNKATNSKNRDASKYTDTKTKKEKTFWRTGWGARPEDGTPYEDWSRYTKQTEQSDPFFWKSYVSEFWREYESRDGKTRPFDFEITQEEEKELLTRVDHSLCIGCCSCETIAPNVFCVDKHSKMNPKSNVTNQKGAKPDKIIDAAQTCPTKAISVEEKETGSRLYPY